MSQVVLTKNDGSQLILSQNAEMPTISDHPVSSSFEVEVIKEGNLAIELKSQTDSILYDGVTGDVLETSSKMVIAGTPLLSGSIVKVTVWPYKVVKNDVQNMIEFKVNGKVCTSRAIRIQGHDIIPLVHVDSITKFKLNDCEKNNQLDKGKHHFRIH